MAQLVKNLPVMQETQEMGVRYSRLGNGNLLQYMPKKSNGERSLVCYNLKGIQARAPFRTKAKLLTILSETL